jgi:hypothetical protein
VQPRELGVIDDETEELAGRNMSVDALVLAAFHFEESLVEAEKGEAEREEFLASGRIVVAGGR